jgi:hypothetical protein
MNILTDIIKLITALIIVSLLIYGSLLAGKLENRQSKYSHPITRSGVTW